MKPKFTPGDLMLIEDHINLLFRTPAASEHRASVDYDPVLCEAARRVARRLGFTLHRGVYVAMLGPTYETRSEYRMVRRIGGDAAGMSTVPEVLAARRAGLRVLGISTITNVGLPGRAPSGTSGHDVIATADAACAKLGAIVRGVLKEEFA